MFPRLFPKKTRRAKLWPLALMMLAAGCSAPRAATTTATLGPLRKIHVQAIADQIATIRQLEIVEPLAIEPLDDAGMEARLRASEGDAPPPSKDFAAIEVAFDLERLTKSGSAPAQQAAAEQAAAQDTAVEHADRALAFYDRSSKKLLYRVKDDNTIEQLRAQRLLIAKQVSRALADRQITPLAASADRDGLLALAALREGDAQATVGMLLAAERGIHPNRVLAGGYRVDGFEIAGRDEATRARRQPSFDGAETSGWLAKTDTARAFVAIDGSRFMAAIHRAGEQGLIAKLYASPPTSSEQILHPNKYLAGDEPTPVAQPAAPTGYRVVESNTLGELGVGVVLARCIGKVKAIRVAEGWAGDHYTVAVDQAGRVALLWSTVWDNDEQASRVAAALSGVRGCWTGKRRGGYRVADELQIKQDGRRVVLVSGIEADAAEPLASSLLESVSEPPRQREMTPVRVAVDVERPKASRATLEGSGYSSHWLGVSMNIPAGAVAELDKTHPVTIEKEWQFYAALAVSERLHADSYHDEVFVEYGATAAKAPFFQGRKLNVVGRKKVQTPLGSGIRQEWLAERSSVRLFITLVPVCYGAGSYVLIHAYGEKAGERLADKWIESLHWLSMDPPPICKTLNPQ